MEQTYRITEFATLTGVTVRALHHYDRLGLLKPKRTRAGYRLYSSGDRDRLEQITALKFIGLPLKQIKSLLDSRSPRAAAALVAQRHALEEQRVRLGRAIQAIDWELYEEERVKQSAGIVRVPDRFNDSRVSLYHDIATATDKGVSVSSERGLALLTRWRAMMDDETQGVDDVVKARMNEAWTGRKTWPPSFKKYVATLYRLDASAWERAADFIEKGLVPSP